MAIPVKARPQLERVMLAPGKCLADCHQEGVAPERDLDVCHLGSCVVEVRVVMVMPETYSSYLS